MRSIENSSLDFGLVDWRVVVFVFLEDFSVGELNGFCLFV
jgi:hypothetical protein